jgi:hypothetical protein
MAQNILDDVADDGALLPTWSIGGNAMIAGQSLVQSAAASACE